MFQNVCVCVCVYVKVKREKIEEKDTGITITSGCRFVGDYNFVFLYFTNIYIEHFNNYKECVL